MLNKKVIKIKIQTVKDMLKGKDEDVNIAGENEDYQKGYLYALEMVLEE